MYIFKIFSLSIHFIPSPPEFTFIFMNNNLFVNFAFCFGNSNIYKKTEQTEMNFEIC